MKQTLLAPQRHIVLSAVREMEVNTKHALPLERSGLCSNNNHMSANPVGEARKFFPRSIISQRQSLAAAGCSPEDKGTQGLL